MFAGVMTRLLCMLDRLLNLGVDVDAIDGVGATAAFQAVCAINVEPVSLLHALSLRLLTHVARNPTVCIHTNLVYVP